MCITFFGDFTKNNKRKIIKLILMNLFSSIKILDLTRVFSGPFATRHFADFGAEIIKIEAPNGDDSRRFPPTINNWSGYFEVLNRNKKSLVLDLKNEQDLKKFYNLCKECDILVENFSPKIKNKLKIDYKNVKNINSKIIYASISGVSENVDKKYYDVIAQAESGLISLNGLKEDVKNATSIIDAFSGMKLAFAISSALYNREKTNNGCYLNVSMKGSAFDLLEQNLITTSITKENPKKVGNMDSAIAPFGIFKTKNKSIVLAIGNNEQWLKFKKLLKENNSNFNNELFITNKLRLENINQLKNEIENIFQKHTSNKIITRLKKINIPCAEINTMLDVINDKENYIEKLLEKINHPVAGKIVASTGGIFFSNYKKESYIPAPILKI